MRKLLTLILSLILAAMPMAMACEECGGWQTGDMLVVTNCKEWVSLRTTASTKAERLARVPLGKSVYYLSEAANGFSHVYYNGMYGYILSEHVEYDGVSCRFVTGCDEWISLRQTASKKAARLEKIPLGAMVSATEMNLDDFMHVNYNGKAGYALREYLSLTPFEPGDVLTVSNCNEYITLRQSPSVNAASLSRIPLGASVTVISEAENGFMCVRYLGQVGYVLSGYLSATMFWAVNG